MAGVRGDFAALADLRRRMRFVTSPAFREEAVHRLAAVATKMLADEFRESRNPYGDAWKPVFRKRRRDRIARGRRIASGQGVRADKPLVDSGRLRAAATAKSADVSGGSMVRIRIPVDYASYHQDGTKHIARRQIVPDAAGGLGPIWRQAMNRELERLVREKLETR